MKNANPQNTYVYTVAAGGSGFEAMRKEYTLIAISYLPYTNSFTRTATSAADNS
ncbi:MAG: hypothetical protein HRT61_24080 [Ekhidna sp.]|nr:hypothetical protein [Ekhidna sp.]